MRPVLAFLSVVVVCQILSYLAVGGSLGAESSVSDGPIGPIADAAPKPDAVLDDPPQQPPPDAAPDAPIVTPAGGGDGGGGCQTGGRPAGPAAGVALVLLALAARGRRRELSSRTTRACRAGTP